MKLHIEDDNVIRNIQNEFNKTYPFLKIEFFKSPVSNRLSQKMEKINPFERIKFVAKVNGPNIINIGKHQTVAQLEKDFEEMFSLKAEVFRKSGNIWIETSLTDDWTLEQQNSEGEFISSHTNQKH